MTPDPLVERLAAAYEHARDPEAATAMAAYMRDQFPFVGIKTTPRRAIDRQIVAGLDPPTEERLRVVAEECWRRPEREYQYFATEYLARHVAVCSAEALGWIRPLITTKSWWDTVDALAANVVGEIVRRHDGQAARMDQWVDDPDLWLARTAILHQLRWKAATDADRLFRYCLARAGDREFFIRKAIGWALREYSKTDPDAVETFVAHHETALSGLSRREALKVIERRRASEAGGAAS
jgi:3-methyladenine DNA glycosylase AlkD